MASILKPFGSLLSPKRAVPTGKLKIDWTHPLASGLVGCWVPGVMGGIDLAGKTAPLSFVASSIGVAPEGPGVIGSSGGNLAMSGPAGSPLYAWTSGFSFYIRGYQGVSDTNSNTNLFSITYNNAVDSPYFILSTQANSGQTGGTVNVNWNSGGNGESIFNAFPQLTAGSSFSRGAALVVNGLAYAYNNGAYTTGNTFGGASLPSYGTLPQLSINGFNSNLYGRDTGSTVYILAFWSRALSADEMAWLDLEPYCFLIPEEAELPALYASGGASTAAGAGSVAITTTQSGVGKTLASVSGASSIATTQSGAAKESATASGAAAIATTQSGAAAKLALGVGSAAISATQAGAAKGSAAGAGSSVITTTQSGVGATLGYASGSGSVVISVGASATGSEFAAGAGSASITTTQSGAGNAVAAGQVAGSVAITTAQVAVGAGLAATASSAPITTSAAAVGKENAAGTGYASITTTQAAVGVAVKSTAGSASITTTQTGVGSEKASGSGSASITTTQSAVGKETAAGAGTAAILFTAGTTSAADGAGSTIIAVGISGGGATSGTPIVIVPPPVGGPLGQVPGGVINVIPPELQKKKKRKPKIIGRSTQASSAPKEEIIYVDASKDVAAILRSMPTEPDNDDEEAIALILQLVA